MQETSFWLQAVPLLLVFGTFYCAVIRPGRLSEARRWAAVKALSGGERVLLESGIVGTFVERIGDEDHGDYMVEVAPDVRLAVREQGIRALLPKPPASDGPLPDEATLETNDAA